MDKEVKNLIKGLEQYQKRTEERRDKKLWQNISLPLSLEAILDRLTKDELMKICRHHDINKVSTLKKGELIAQLAVTLPKKLQSELSIIDEERYLFLKDFMSEDKREIIIMEASDIDTAEVDYWRSSGFIFTGSVDEQNILFMPQEILNAFQALNHQSLLKTVQRNSEWILLTHGMLFYYGVLGFNQIRTGLKELTGIEPDLLELHRILISAKEYYDLLEIDHYGHWSYFAVEDTDKVLQEHRARPSVEFKKFSKNKLLKAGHPDYLDQNPAFHRFSAYLLDHFEMEEFEAQELTFECQYLINNDQDLKSLIDYLGKSLEFPSFEILQQITAEVTYLFNNTRQWILKGHTPEELFQEEKKHLTPLPAHDFTPVNSPLPFHAPIVQPAGSKTHNKTGSKNNVIDFKTHKKIGRNDPCPCGSGKKFKQCCGKA